MSWRQELGRALGLTADEAERQRLRGLTARERIEEITLLQLLIISAVILLGVAFYFGREGVQSAAVILVVLAMVQFVVRTNREKP